ncbi:hypothetical protein DIPPA_17189 [Diplonema papillatum]|nr:hypothetical protein DIPPA_17189 [Diplonema papillatum]
MTAPRLPLGASPAPLLLLLLVAGAAAEDCYFNATNDFRGLDFDVGGRMSVESTVFRSETVVMYLEKFASDAGRLGGQRSNVMFYRSTSDPDVLALYWLQPANVDMQVYISLSNIDPDSIHIFNKTDTTTANNAVFGFSSSIDWNADVPSGSGNYIYGAFKGQAQVVACGFTGVRMSEAWKLEFSFKRGTSDTGVDFWAGDSETLVDMQVNETVGWQVAPSVMRTTLDGEIVREYPATAVTFRYCVFLVPQGQQDVSMSYLTVWWLPLSVDGITKSGGYDSTQYCFEHQLCPDGVCAGDFPREITLSVYEASAECGSSKKSIFVIASENVVAIPETSAPTSAPSTRPPDTLPPQTSPPSTSPPHTSAPSTSPPHTSAPPTNPPRTPVPATLPPHTSAPSTSPPHTSAPPTNPPRTPVPATLPPHTSAPATGQPLPAETGNPVTASPLTLAPRTQHPQVPPSGAPKTAAPETTAPRTVRPATGVPSTMPHDTEAPRTAGPGTSRPSSAPDTLSPPTATPSGAPPTQLPSSAPSSDMPSSAPATDVPSSAPTTLSPYHQVSTAPMTAAPETDSPDPDQPVPGLDDPPLGDDENDTSPWNSGEPSDVRFEFEDSSGWMIPVFVTLGIALCALSCGLYVWRTRRGGSSAKTKGKAMRNYELGIHDLLLEETDCYDDQRIDEMADFVPPALPFSKTLSAAGLDGSVAKKKSKTETKKDVSHEYEQTFIDPDLSIVVDKGARTSNFHRITTKNVAEVCLLNSCAQIVRMHCAVVHTACSSTGIQGSKI